jgi:hypothetical protein
MPHKQSPEVRKKVELLKKELKNILELSSTYQKRYRSLKKKDDLIDFCNSLLSGTAIICIIIGFSNPVALISAGVLNGVAFVTNRAQAQWNLKHRYNTHKTTYDQYSALAREITTVLHKNNLSSEQYGDYLEEIYDKISLIQDSQL